MTALASSYVESQLGLPAGSFPFESRFVDVAGARIHYIDEGTGPVLLMLHGNPTWSYLFRYLVAGLRDRFRCIALDYPGFGFSTAPSGYGYRPEDHAPVVEAFVETLELSRFTPFVQDWGGPIGLWVASRLHDRIERVVIGNTWAWPIRGDFHFEAFSWVMGGPFGRVAIPYFNAFVNLMIPGGTKSEVDAVTMRAYRNVMTTPRRRMATWIFPRSITHSAAFLAECERGLAALAAVPALIVWGDRDVAFRASERERFEAAFPNHRTAILRGAGHFVWQERPDEILAALRDWWPR